MGLFGELLSAIGDSLLNETADILAEDMSNEDLCKQINDGSLMGDYYIKELLTRLRAVNIEELIDDYIEYKHYGYSSKITNAYIKVISNKVNNMGVRQRKYLRKNYGGLDEKLYDIL